MMKLVVKYSAGEYQDDSYDVHCCIEVESKDTFLTAFVVAYGDRAKVIADHDNIYASLIKKYNATFLQYPELSRYPISGSTEALAAFDKINNQLQASRETRYKITNKLTVLGKQFYYFPHSFDPKTVRRYLEIYTLEEWWDAHKAMDA
jgi:hypothetical protein